MALPLDSGLRAPKPSLMRYYEELVRSYGPQGWWPARTRLEVIVGAILTQNAAWRNAELAIRQLRNARLLNLRKLMAAEQGEIESCIRPAGFFRQKAATIRRFLDFLGTHHCGSLTRLFSQRAADLRERLLAIKGLGPESVDAILLYAGDLPFFVADAYTRRILSRHGWLRTAATYAEAQAFLHRELPRDAALFNEFHALLVETGKRYCHRSAPKCGECPLRYDLPAVRLSSA